MKQIAGLLSVSKQDVEYHKYHIMKTFNLRSKADMVLYAVKRGLVCIKS
jgi:DNA-binding NarL/FixJ family response regulator